MRCDAEGKYQRMFACLLKQSATSFTVMVWHEGGKAAITQVGAKNPHAKAIAPDGSIC